MALPALAAFVMQPYRYESDEDATIKATYKNAEEMIFETNLDGTTAAALATKIFNVVSGFAEAYSVTVEGVYTSDMFEGGPPLWTLTDNSLKTDGRTFRTVGTSVNWMENTTTFVIRG